MEMLVHAARREGYLPSDQDDFRDEQGKMIQYRIECQRGQHTELQGPVHRASHEGHAAKENWILYNHFTNVTESKTSPYNFSTMMAEKLSINRLSASSASSHRPSAPSVAPS
ncbi:hypothetical protein MBANPS3_003514 [Mucor bainieri]